MAESRTRGKQPAWVKLVVSLARLLGSARLIGIQTAVVVVWVLGNLTLQITYLSSHPALCVTTLRSVRVANTSLPGCGGAHPIDFYPFVLLNLLFSLSAAYATPIILFVKNRSADDDRTTVQLRRQVADDQQQNIHFIARELADMRRVISGGLTESYATRAIDGFGRDLRARVKDRRRSPSAGAEPPPL